MTKESKIDALMQSTHGKTMEQMQQEHAQSMTEQGMNGLKAADIINSVVAKTPEQVEVGGIKYGLKKFTMSEWLKYTPFLGKQFGVPMAMGLENALSEEKDTAIAESVYILFQNMEGGSLEAIVDLLLTKVTMNGVPVKADDFVNPYDLFEVCTGVLMLNYSDFFTKGISRLMEALTKTNLVASTLSQ